MQPNDENIGVYAKLYNEGQSPKKFEFALHLDPEKTSYSNGDNFKLLVDIQTPSESINADLYFVCLIQQIMFTLDRIGLQHQNRF